ncbi:hypothetical protein BCR33DRAFT_389472 [Rhizoclosmatium globosum]|uniref:Homeobox domain-containing protein n=1 Tax=Rhizoclosmatium globosum TaxID=329046 RepID=A0A1Y2BXI7_9FUNG|nr:hypothetical protein BCR33DRAFT_389472 [Rhizoclosmatium globosum]|eukprot:ORY39490.1 hypothetical protein BCR33DRAFT_389472 [Rhizoclosmatium globosum]
MAAPSAPMSVRLPSISALLSALPSPTSSNAHHLTQQSPHFQSPHQRHVFHGMHKKSYSVDSPAYFRNSSSSVQPVMPPPQAPIHQRSQSHLIYNAPVTPTHRKTSSMDSNGSSISSAPSTPYLVGGPSNSVDSSPQTTMPQIQYRYHPQQHPQQPHNGVTYVEIPAPLTERQLPGPMYPREQQSQYAPSNQQPPQFHHAIHRRVHHVRTNSAPVFASSPSPVVINTNQQQGHRHQIIVPPSAVSASHRAQHRPHNVPQNRMEQDPQIALFRQEQRMHQERLQQQQQHQALQQQYHQQTQQQSTTQHSAPVTRVPSPIRTQLEPDSVSSSSPSSDDDANYNESPDKDEDDGPVLLNANGNPIKRRLRANREQLRVLESVFVKNKTPSPRTRRSWRQSWECRINRFCIGSRTDERNW